MSLKLGLENPVPELMPAYEFRPEQVAFSNLIEQCLASGTHAAIEAGTGIGKTIGYLVPVLSSKRRVLISTYTKLLQDQLIGHDLTVAAEIAASHQRVKVLKGRQNYVCQEKLQIAVRNAQSPLTPTSYDRLIEIWQWSTSTPGGDLSDLTDLEPDLHALVTASANECLNSQCPSFERCSYFKARDEASDAEILIVNHQLLMTGSSPENGALRDIFKRFDTCLIDEAEQWPQIMREAGSLVYDLKWMPILAQALRGQVGIGAQRDAALLQWCTTLLDTSEALRRVRGDKLNVHAVTSIEKAQLILMCDQLESLLSRLLEALDARRTRSRQLSELTDECAGQLDRILVLGGDLEIDEQRYFWRSGTEGPMLYRSDWPVSNDAPGHNQGLPWVADSMPCLFVSASLTVNKSFDFFKWQLPVQIDATYRIGSPFQYSNQVLGFKPSRLPRLEASDYMAQLLSSVERLLSKKSLVLVTSKKALNAAAEHLRGQESGRLFVQGEQDTVRLVEQFKAANTGTLLATMGFWQGLDLAGAGVECLVIDRLPFRAPADPLLLGIKQQLEDSNSDFFLDFLLPDCALKLRQGFGRLIRRASDRGIFVVGDERYWNAPYASQLQDCLPDFPWTHALDDAAEFIGIEK